MKHRTECMCHPCWLERKRVANLPELEQAALRVKEMCDAGSISYQEFMDQLLALYGPPAPPGDDGTPNS